MAIKKLQNNFTTAEQSKRLLELGVPADSADCFRFSLGKNTSNFGMPRYCYRPYTELLMYDYSGIYTLLPCWSVGRLIEIFELCTGVLWQDTAQPSVIQPTLIERVIETIVLFNKHGHMDFSKLEE